MSDSQSTAMDAEERNALLGNGGTGVIAFAASEFASEQPHAVPVSYGYDAQEGVFYFRLATAPDDTSATVADSHVTFVVHGQDEEGRWRSVVAKGTLTKTTEQSVSTDSLDGLQRVHIPLVDIFDRPTAEVSFEFYRLNPVEVTGRKETSTAA